MDEFKTIYSDFDGTITKKDTVKDFLEEFGDKSRLVYKNLWVNGKISSLENTKLQISSVKNVSEKALDKFLAQIELSDGFLEFYEYLVSNGIKLVILSNGFDMFIKRVLERHGIEDVEIFANRLTYQNEMFSIDFPFYDPRCELNTGVCKCSKIQEENFCYIGDGITDFCVAKKARKLYATKRLRELCEKFSIPHTPFENFYEVLNHFKNDFPASENY